MGSTITKVSVRDIYKSFTSSDGQINNVIRGISLDLFANKFTSLVGPNGCGKSTLLNVIAGTLNADSGFIDFENSKSEEHRVGYVWQDYRSSLLPWLNATENVSFPLKLQGLEKKVRTEKAEEMMREFLPGVEPEKPCYQLSGGQQQLLCLLRSAIAQPDILLFDEPFSALDQNKRWSFSTYVERIWQTSNAPALFVSHDVDEAVLISDNIVLMNKKGQIEDVIVNPLPRPRNQKMLTDKEHLKCRDSVISFLLTQN